MAVYHGARTRFVDYGFVGYCGGSWPEQRIAHTYCGYCTRQHSEGKTQCDGCGAPVTAPGRIDALQQHLDRLEREPVRHPDMVVR